MASGAGPGPCGTVAREQYRVNSACNKGLVGFVRKEIS